MPLSPAALEPLLRLALVPGVGPQRLAGLIGRYGSAEEVFRAPPRELELLPGLGAAARGIRAAAGEEGRRRAAEAFARMRRVEAMALTPDDPAYPDAFRPLADAPFLLFAAGDLSLMEGPSVAVVGTRSPSEYGRASAAGLCAALAEAGYCIVSGMARGIDTIAHGAALDREAPSVGVLGHGIEQVYPPESRDLFRRMREHALLLTEFPPGERPRAGNFPRRNRLIAALSLGVLVVEMGLKSGAQHTVTYALELGKEVFAVPGPIGAPTSAGTNQLIKEGARLVTSAEDVLEELEGVGGFRPAPRPRPEPAQAALPLLAPAEEHLLGALQRETRHVDELVAATGRPAGAVLATLLELELRGLVLSLPGKQYRRA